MCFNNQLLHVLRSLLRIHTNAHNRKLTSILILTSTNIIVLHNYACRADHFFNAWWVIIMVVQVNFNDKKYHKFDKYCSSHTCYSATGLLSRLQTNSTSTDLQNPLSLNYLTVGKVRYVEGYCCFIINIIHFFQCPEKYNDS